jgi:hypothetical protein
MTGRWFSPGTPVSSTNKTDRHSKTEVLLKLALSTIKRNQTVLGYIKKKEILCQHSLINTNFGGNI